MKTLLTAVFLTLGAVFVVASPAFADHNDEIPVVMDLTAVENEISAAKTFCVNPGHLEYWRLIDDSLAEVIYFCDGRYEGIWIYAAHPVLLMGSDLTESSFRGGGEILLVKNDNPQSTKYIVDTSTLIFLGIGYEAKRPSYLPERIDGDDLGYLEYLTLLPQKIVSGVDFSKRK